MLKNVLKYLNIDIIVYRFKLFEGKVEIIYLNGKNFYIVKILEWLKI